MPFFKSVSLVVFEPKSTVVLVHQFFALKRILLKKRYIFHLPRVKMRKAVTRFRKSLLKTASILKLPCEQLVSPTLPERETTASNRLIFHRSEVRYIPRDVFDITSSYFAGNLYTAGSPKRSSYVAERTRKRQNKFTNLFYRFKFNLFVLGVGRRLTQKTNAFSQWFLSREA